MGRKAGKEYEKIVASIHEQFSENASITENEYISGKSGRKRQIDVVIRSKVIGYDVLIIVQAKDYKTRRVDIEKVDSLIGTLEDVNATKGILVSDSGFSQGAIERAKQDGRIELVSVVDVENKKLKSQITIPTLAEIISVKDFQFQVKETGTVPFSMDWKFMVNVKNKFAKLWNSEILNHEIGQHSYIDLQINTEKQKLEITYNYSVEKRTYTKEVGLEKGVGIYNFRDGSFISKEIISQMISLDEIENTWEKTENESQESFVLKIILFEGLSQLKV